MANSAIKEQSTRPFFLEKVLAQFTQRFSKPSAELLSVRCISKIQLIKQLVLIRDELEFPGHKRTSGSSILLHLEQSGLVHPVASMNPKTKEIEDKFYVIGIESGVSTVSPIELLQAQESKGVVCYFTALEFYGMTTQIPSHHHIAVLGASSPNLRNKDTKKELIGSLKPGRNYDPLGTKRFIFEDVPYYVTNRDKKLVPGIQERYLDEKSIFRITSYDQTLLDTLHRPISCGGPSVVFEAWHSAFDRLSSNLIYEYLSKINSSELSRRVGYMLQVIDYKVDGKISELFDSIKASIPREDSESIISLLPGFDYSELNEEWFLKVP